MMWRSAPTLWKGVKEGSHAKTFMKNNGDCFNGRNFNFRPSRNGFWKRADYSILILLILLETNPPKYDRRKGVRRTGRTKYFTQKCAAARKIHLTSSYSSGYGASLVESLRRGVADLGEACTTSNAASACAPCDRTVPFRRSARRPARSTWCTLLPDRRPPA